MSTVFATELKKTVITHRHRPRTIKICDNYRATVIVYCADCKEQLNQYFEEWTDYFEGLTDYDECFIGATDSTGIS